jgi:hypothetical protein
MITRNKLAAGPFSVVAGLCLIAALGTCISCASEDSQTPSNGGGASTSPSGSESNPAVSADPNTQGQPPYYGLYGNVIGDHAYIWPDGTFVTRSPKWDSQGVFDADLTADYYRDELWGHLELTPNGKTSFKVKVNFASGLIEDAALFLSKAGRWEFSGNQWESGIRSRVPLDVERRNPVGVSSVSGVFVRQWDHSTIDNPGEGQYGTDLHASGVTIFDFKPGNRVYLKNATKQVTLGTIGTTGGGTTSSGDSDFGSTNVEGEGDYVIEGYRMRIYFDNGDVLEHLFDLMRGYVVFGNAYAELKK